MSLYGDVDMTRVLFGVNARQVPAWLYVQDQADGMVSFVGASKVEPGQPHPLRYGPERTHQFVVGELIVRPQLVVATDALRGMGLSGLIQQGYPDFDAMLRRGETVIGKAPR